MVPVILHRARWVAPISRPAIADGAVAVADGRILAVGLAQELVKEFPGELLDHGEGVILPGLVNAHVHLEFTALHARIPRQENLGAWLEAAMSRFANLSSVEIREGVKQGIDELWRFGTALAAEVSNTGQSFALLAQSPLAFHYFYECLGFHLAADRPLEVDFPLFGEAWVLEEPHFSAAAHAPYSVSASLFGRVQGWNRERGRLSAVHLAESREEVEFINRGEGFFKDFLKKLGRWRPDFQPPGCSPVQYLEGLGFLKPDLLAAHGVWVEDRDLDLLARRGVRVVLCPRSNIYTGAGFPDLPRLAGAYVNLALGTDSLASNEDLNLFGEMLALHERYPDFPLQRLLFLATLGGARALRREPDFGSLEAGKRAALLFVPVSSQGDFWEPLLHAGAQGEMRWLSAAAHEATHAI